MLITSKQNPVVKELASLKEKKGRSIRKTYLVEGGKMVHECMESGLVVERIIVREDYAGEQFPYPTVELGSVAFAAICDEKTPQGICAEVRIPAYPLESPKGSCLLLDGVADPSNVGAIIRTAIAAGYEELYLADCADPYAPKAVRSSMSGIFFAKIMRGTREEILGVLEGVELIAADMGGTDVFKFTSPAKFCLCIGSEARGLSAQVRSRANHTVKIPMDARTESLNAAVSAGILMYTLRQRSRN